jgi:hypothetical protein
MPIFRDWHLETILPQGQVSLSLRVSTLIERLVDSNHDEVQLCLCNGSIHPLTVLCKT